MLSKQEIENLRDALGGLLDMGDRGPFAPEQRDEIYATHNALCFILEDGSPHARTFKMNLGRLYEWCERNNVLLIPRHQPDHPTH